MAMIRAGTDDKMSLMQKPRFGEGEWDPDASPVGRVIEMVRQGQGGILSARCCFPRDLLGGLTGIRRHHSKPSRPSLSVTGDAARARFPLARNKMAGSRSMHRLPAIRFLGRAPHAIGTNGRAYFVPSSFGFSAISASLVSSKVATLAAFSSAVRTTLVGSITPDSTKSSYLSVAAL